MINEVLLQYMQSIQPVRSDIYNRLENIAKEEGIPIIMQEAGYFIQMVCSIYKPKHVLEIGTAIGYSALWILDSSDAFLETIEIDEERVARSQQLFNETGYTERVKVHYGDAIDILPTFHKEYPFDLVFIDAAKGQYIKYFEQLETLTKSGAIVITDNVFFHGMVPGINEPSKKLEPLIKKIKQYNLMLKNNEKWHTTFYSVGDGISVSIKR